MGFLSELSALAGLADRASEQVEYWREFEGERIVIITQNVKRTPDKHHENVRLTNYVIEGEIDDVMSFPPGFRLKNVKESIDMTNYNFTTGSRNLDTGTAVSLDDEKVVKEIDQKFVSFDSIEQVERVEHRENMSEPILDKIGDDKYMSNDKHGDANDMLG